MNTVVAMETASKCARWEIKDAWDVDLAVFLDVHFALLLQGMMCSGGEEDNLCPPPVVCGVIWDAFFPLG